MSSCENRACQRWLEQVEHERDDALEAQAQTLQTLNDTRDRLNQQENYSKSLEIRIRELQLKSSSSSYVDAATSTNGDTTPFTIAQDTEARSQFSQSLLLPWKMLVLLHQSAKLPLPETS
jgi:hypothetical protein